MRFLLTPQIRWLGNSICMRVLNAGAFISVSAKMTDYSAMHLIRKQCLRSAPVFRVSRNRQIALSYIERQQAQKHEIKEQLRTSVSINPVFPYRASLSARPFREYGYANERQHQLAGHLPPSFVDLFFPIPYSSLSSRCWASRLRPDFHLV